MAWEQLISQVNVSPSNFGHVYLQKLADAYTNKGWTITVNQNANAAVGYFGSMFAEKNVTMADNTSRRFAFLITMENTAATRTINLHVYAPGVSYGFDGYGMPTAAIYHTYNMPVSDIDGTWNYWHIPGDDDAFVIFNSTTNRIISFFPPSGTMHDSVCVTAGGPDVGLLPMPLVGSNQLDLVYRHKAADSESICHPFGGVGSAANFSNDYQSAMPPSFYNFATVITEPDTSSFVPYFTDLSGNIGMFTNFTSGDVIGDGINTLRVGTTYYIQLGSNNGLLLNAGTNNPGF